MTKFALRIAPMLLALLALAACGKSQPESAAIAKDAAPHEAVLATAELISSNDIGGYLKATLPPAKFAEIKKEWQEKKAEPITDEDRAEFAKQMETLTAADAEEKMFAKLQPFFAEYDTKFKAQLPMYVGMGQTMAASSINQSKELTSEQKQQVMDVMGAMAGWVTSTDWSDQAKAKQAIAAITGTARELDIQTLDQLRALSFEQVLDKASIAMGGVKKVFATYGFDIDKSMDSLTAETVSQTGDTAKVKYSYTLLGQPLSGTMELVQRDGRWYNKKTLESFDKAMAKASADASTGGEMAEAPAEADAAVAE